MSRVNLGSPMARHFATILNDRGQKSQFSRSVHKRQITSEETRVPDMMPPYRPSGWLVWLGGVTGGVPNVAFVIDFCMWNHDFELPLGDPEDTDEIWGFSDD